MEPATNPAPMSAPPLGMDAFFTRSRANEGIEFPLDRPDGTPTAERIKIRGVDSDAYKRASADSYRRLLEIATSKEKKTVTNEDQDTERLKLIGSLVISWTLTDECTPENVVKLLREAPQVAEQIDRIAGRRELFFLKG